MVKKTLTRRTFIASSASAIVFSGCATSDNPVPAKPTYNSPNNKLNLAAIGSGGKGGSDIRMTSAGENVVALCDVDWPRAAEAFKKWPDVPKYKDFRVMLEKEKSIDGVTISTPDHVHGVAAIMAMEMDKHVYVQKPLTHTIWEARKLTELAAERGLVTQMGNQGHSGDGVRELCELIWDGAIGQVSEAHIWTNRPVWPQGIGRPPGSDPVREGLDWDLWLGPAPDRPFIDKHPETGNDCYCPFVWRGWWDFGCGALGDMACHIMDPAYWALKLDFPTSVEATHVKGMTSETGPTESIIKFEFAQRGDMRPVTIYWYDGGLKPERPEGIPDDVVLGDGDNGSFFVGDKGIATTGEYGGETRLLPDELEKSYTRPDPSIARIKGANHYKDWADAIKTGATPCSHFGYSGPFTEMVLLGNLSLRLGTPLQWDYKNLRFTNSEEANRLVKRTNRAGW